MVLFHLMDNHGDSPTRKDFQLTIIGPETALLWHHFGVTMTSEGVEMYATLCTARQREHPISRGERFWIKSTPTFRNSSRKVRRCSLEGGSS